jgi:hypothetical protein
MTISNRIAASLMAAALFTGASFSYAQNSQKQNQNQAPYTTSATPDWNTPPPGTEQAQQGYRDGIEAAKLDTLAHRAVDPTKSHLYVHPPVKGAAVADYRSSFEQGYKTALKNQGAGAM